jgi:predicted nucleic acid-binding protein
MRPCRCITGISAGDVVDGFVAVKAAETGATVITSDPGDIQRLMGTLGIRLPVLKP